MGLAWPEPPALTSTVDSEQPPPTKQRRPAFALGDARRLSRRILALLHPCGGLFAGRMPLDRSAIGRLRRGRGIGGKPELAVFLVSGCGCSGLGGYQLGFGIG